MPPMGHFRQFHEQNQRAASPSAPDGFIATAKTPVWLNLGPRAFDRKRHDPDIASGQTVDEAKTFFPAPVRAEKDDGSALQADHWLRCGLSAE
jgi:hypothetical protein